MNKQLWNLRKIIDLEKWQKLQDSLASTTKLAIITVDYKGIPVTAHSLCNRFCQEIRRDTEMFQQCKRCDARGGLEAVRQNAPYIYYCHCNVIDLAIPIIVDNKYLGAVMAGQAMLDPAEAIPLERIVTIDDPAHAQKQAALQSLYRELPVLPFSEIQRAATMLFQLTNYIVEEAVGKNQILEMYNHPPSPESSAKNPWNGDMPIALRCANATLRPAFNYINEHKNEMLTLKRAAALCHISTSHFSRLFAKETGENYSTFIARLKISWSKKLLMETDLSVSAISNQLGYSEAGYFIKTFKKHEGVTPLLYRKYYTG